MLHPGQDEAALDFGLCDIHGDCGAGVVTEGCLERCLRVERVLGVE